MKFIQLLSAGVSLAANFTIESSLKNSLPSDFVYGYASSSTQVEGATDKFGKSPSQWDVFASIPGNIADGSNPNMTINEYENFDRTLAALKETGANAYRFSIAWPRLIPGGIAGSPVNQEAVKHYKKVIDQLLANGITPLVTLYHWDIPQILNDKYDGLLNTENFVRDYLYFADVAFKSFGDKVKSWATFNEPITQCLGGYGNGIHPPGHKNGASAKGMQEVYRCGHSILLAHAKAVNLLRTTYASQKAKVTLVNYLWMAKSIRKWDLISRTAAQRMIDLNFGWFVDPVMFGDYPNFLKLTFGTLGWLPKFTDEEKALLKGSVDFVGFNMYNGNYFGWNTDFMNDVVKVIGNTTPDTTFEALNEIFMNRVSNVNVYYPELFLESFKYIQSRYNDPEIYVMETGFNGVQERFQPLEQAADDQFRVDLFNGYLGAMQTAMQEYKVKVKGILIWTLFDNFEWNDGFNKRFGVFTRDGTPKQSSTYLKQYFKTAISS